MRKNKKNKLLMTNKKEQPMTGCSFDYDGRDYKSLQLRNYSLQSSAALRM